MSIFQGTRGPGIGWFRVFGYGLHWKDERRHRLLFSERHGFRSPHFRIGTWRFRFMGPGNTYGYFDAIATAQQDIMDARLFDETMAQTNKVLDDFDLGGEA